MSIENRLKKLLKGPLAPYLVVLKMKDPELYKFIMTRLGQR